jgi:hypothetical protein
MSICLCFCCCLITLPCTAATRESCRVEVPAQLLLSCKYLTALRQLQLTISTTNRNTITALDALALAELTALTSLQLSVEQDAAARIEEQQQPSVAELSPLTRLTALRQLAVHNWKPQQLAEAQLPTAAAAPATADACCQAAACATYKPAAAAQLVRCHSDVAAQCAGLHRAAGPADACGQR